jgi:uncharacterized membrane protein YdjX (TVP38/TMEM64 family)
MTRRAQWLVGTLALALVLGLVAVSLWIKFGHNPTVHRLLRLYTDPAHFRNALHRWGVLAPLVFIGIQALQVLIAPIPGELTGFLGGLVFGQWWGLFYSMIGLTAGSLFAFGIGRWLGMAFVQRLVTPAVWARLGFVVETEGAVLCFLLYLIPGLPKDILCYLFGLSPMPFWVFAVASTLGRIPGTWVLSAQGAKTATGHYVEVALILALFTAVGLPLYAFRDRIVTRFRRESVPSAKADGNSLRSDR